MKRVIPPELLQLHGWLLSKSQFDDANFVLDMIKAIENGERINFKDSFRFERLLKMYRKITLLSGR